MENKDIRLKKRKQITLDTSHGSMFLLGSVVAAIISVLAFQVLSQHSQIGMKLQLLKKLECRPTEIKMSNINRDGAVVVCFPDGSKKAPISPKVPRARRGA